MPQPSQFERDTAVRSAGDGVYESEVAEGWEVLRGPHGGYVAAIVVRALEAEVGDAGRQARSLTIHFAAPPEPGPVRIECRVERAGRSLTTVSARMDQDGRAMAIAVAAFSVPWPELFGYSLEPPAVTAPEETESWPWQEGQPSFRRHLEFRPLFGGPLFGGSGEPLTGGWLRTNEPPRAFDAAYVAMLADAWVPAPFVAASEPFVAPTIDMTVHFRSQLPPAGMEPSDPVLGRFESRHSAEGFFEEDGELWSPAGVLIAQSRQLALGMRRIRT